jgi:hypothetical protein
LKLDVNEATEQLSLAVGAVHVAGAEQLPTVAGTLMLPGQFAIAGASLSVTVTVNEQVDVLPAASVAV